MDTQKSLNILIQAVQIGQKAGAYTLQDAKVIAEALEVFSKKSPIEETLQGETSSETDAHSDTHTDTQS